MRKLFKLFLCFIMALSFMLGAMTESKTHFYNLIPATYENSITPVNKWLEDKSVKNEFDKWFSNAKIATAICYVIVADGFKWHYIRAP